MPFIQFLIHDDTLAVRHVLLEEGQDIVHFHSGYTREDCDAGWRSVKGVWLDDEQAVRQEELEAVAHSRQFWEDLLRLPEDRRVVWQGHHHTVHESGTTAGFGGKLFEIRWLAPDRAPVVGHLWAQGRIPEWVRPRLPDNATEFVERADLLNPFAVEQETADVDDAALGE